MTQRKITAVVEGQGELAAVPVLLRRIAAKVVPDEWVEFPRPHRISRGSLVAPGGVERAIATIAEQGGPQDSVLVLLDADDDCPVDLAARLRARIRTARSDRGSSVVVANREFEAWFLAAAPSLRGRRGLARDLKVPADPEAPRDCKGWLSRHRVDGRSYRPAADQAALAAEFDLDLARYNSPSFSKLWRDMERLLRGPTG